MTELSADPQQAANPVTAAMLYDSEKWLGRCEGLALEASRGCGLSFDVYLDRFNALVDNELARFSESDRAAAQAVAATFDYESAHERQQRHRDLDRDGACRHGLDPQCCPVGCGDI